MMTVHVLSAGSGYTYLTQQVASGDVPRERGMSLTDYYMQHGNPPGRWVGTGLEQLGVSGRVTEKQMKSLYGQGRHADAGRLEVEALARGATKHDAERAGWIGRAFPTFEPRPDDGFRTALEAALAQFAQENDRPPEAGIERDLIRWNVARTLAQKEKSDKGSGTVTDADVAQWLAKRGQQPRRAVAGYDLVFTPSKSVSVLWGLGDPATREAITKAHTDAWHDTLAWIEAEGALTREGAGGVRQIDTHGLTAVAFDHLDSRTGDPNLHTHVAISAKVRGVDGTWRALDGRVLLNLAVAASERYNTRIEQLLVDRLGVAFHTETRGRGRQGVREIVGIPKKLREAFSRRRAAIQESYETLRAGYRAKYGHEPASKIAYALAQQANLDTRQAKGTPVGLRDRLPQWHQVATTVLGSSSAVARMLTGALHPRPGTGRVGVDELEHLWPAVAQDLAGRGVARWTAQDVTAALERLAHTWPRAQVFRSLRRRTTAGRQAALADLAARVLAGGDLVDACLTGVADKRATWSTYHLQAEATRLAREHAPTGTDLLALSATIAGHAVAGSLVITPPDLNEPPDVMRRKDGESVYFVHGSTRYTSLAVLEAEDHLLVGARAGGGLITDQGTVERAVARVEAGLGHRLNRGQRELVAHFATSGTRLAAGIGPAGTGKTTAMRAFAAAVDDAGGRLIALAPSAAAAEVLSADLGDPDITAETLDMFLLANAGRGGERLRERLTVEEGTVVLVDEASLAGTISLARVLAITQTAGGSVRLLGDPAQLGAVAAGGALRLIAEQAGAVQLTQIHRFHTAGEAEASLLLRNGNHKGLDFYVTRHRTQGGSAAQMAEEMFANWQTDSDHGRKTIMIAATNTLVTELSARARLHRVTRGEVEEDGVVLHDNTRAGVGDVIVTRLNNRYLHTEHDDDLDDGVGGGGRDWVKNGDLWRVIARGKDGALQARHLTTGATVVLPADYVAGHVELGYAATIHRVQGMTVDTSHAMVGVGMTRNELYTAITRGRDCNRVYVETDDVLDLDPHRQPNLERAVLYALKAVLDRDGEEKSTSRVIEEEWDYAHSLARLVPEYEDADLAFLEPDRTGRLAEALRAVLPERMTYLVLEDEAWPALAKRLSQHEAAGADVQAVVHRAAQQGFQGARSIAKVLHHRIDLPRRRDLDQRGLPAWITVPPDTTENLDWNDARPLTAPEADQADPQPASSSSRPGAVPDNTATDRARSVPGELTAETVRSVDAGEWALVVEITGHAWTWWTQQIAHQSWATQYMTGRGLAPAEWGTAPASWTGLSDHLQTLGYTPDQLVTAGVATRTRSGRLIDKFRNRIVFPYRDQTGAVVGVTARINPDHDDSGDGRTPKYLNTPETAAYRKGELLLGLDPTAITRLAAGARPVLVEGPTDHAALRLAATGLAERTGIEIVPVAAGGTGVTEAHLQALREATGRDLSDLIVALDPDNAGRTAAARVWEMLTAHEAAHAQALDLPHGTDPAQAALDAEALAVVLGDPVPLAWFAMEPNLQHIRSLDHSERQISLLQALVDHLYDRVELAQWWDLVDHVAKIVGNSPGAAAHVQLDVQLVRRVMIDHLTDRITADVPTYPGQDVDSGAEVDNAPGSAREQVVTHPLVRTWLVRHADLIATRLDALVEDAVTNPQLWMETITPPPSADPTRGAWAAAIRQVIAYRDRYQVTDPTHPLGASGHEGERGDAYAIAARALASITATEDVATRPIPVSGPRPMERVPVVLADALARTEQIRRDADERARRDHADRGYERAASRSW
jgi:DNA primase catalytic core